MARWADHVIKAGGTISVGAHNAAGLWTNEEMWALVMGGASPMEALRAATVNGAAKIGVDRELGTLEVGKLADLVVLTANPLDDIRNSTAIKYVVAGGVIYDGETLTSLWPVYRRLSRMGWQSVEEYSETRASGAAGGPAPSAPARESISPALLQAAAYPLNNYTPMMVDSVT
jgi:hypothetical protein